MAEEGCMAVRETKDVCKMEEPASSLGGTPVVCLVCDRVIKELHRQDVPNVFLKSSVTSHSQQQLADMLSVIIKNPLDSSQVYSKTLCRRCFRLLDELDGVEQRSLVLKSTIEGLYNRSFLRRMKGPGTNEEEAIGAMDLDLPDEEEEEDENAKISVKMEPLDDEEDFLADELRPEDQGIRPDDPEFNPAHDNTWRSKTRSRGRGRSDLAAPAASTGAHVHDGFTSYTDVGDPQPSTSSHKSVITPAPAVPLPGDSDWENEDEVDSPDYFDDSDSTDSDCSYEELEWDEVFLDYVSAHDTSKDSGEPLSEVACRCSACNAPGSKGWKGWYMEENVPRCYSFSGTPGLKDGLGLEKDSTAKEIFNCFFPPELWQTIERETNLYGQQRPPYPSSHMKAWEDTTVEELQMYIALHLLMGVQPRPSYRWYWSENPVVNSGVFRKTMTRDRYDLLRSNLHFSDNEDPAATDDYLWKLRPVINTLQSCFKKVFTPERKVTVSELLGSDKGRHRTVKNNPSKRARFSMKVYKLCGSGGKAAGYTSAFKIYIGQNRSDEVPSSMKAVVDLMHEAGLFEKGYQLYLNNWYSSPQLFHYLQSRKTEAIGTVRLNCKFMPKDLSVRRKGDIDIRTSREGMMAMAWLDNEQVNILSTMHKGNEIVDLPTNKRGLVKRKPLCIVVYNNGMKRFDTSDQLAHSYPGTRKTNKWYMNIFYNLLNMAIVNAHAVHKWLGGKMTQLDFRLQLIAQFLQQPKGMTEWRRRSVTPPHGVTPARSPHSPSQSHASSNPATHTLQMNAGRKYRRCKYCRESRAKRMMSRYVCPLCDVALCATCFSDYHAAL
ncbi:piggyBac transposable element-derived protein 4-like isoform X3 [Penaeus japonicus]|nr:piggyBac transposable element-derived protein 4-like isoform X3 [Penaeus japonicus]XP_042860556.1 piggyBac transposable element-derived protein 4-like isoform X3 [Penaeus japonicus]